jgi:hypothetical protein
MLGIFKNKEEEKPDWFIEAGETRDRWFVFLDKLEQKIQALCEEAIPVLEETLRTDGDLYKREFGRLQSGILGQLNNIREKAYQTNQEKVLDTFGHLTRIASSNSSFYHAIYDLKIECSDRYHKTFDEKYHFWSDKIRNIKEGNLEEKYQKIIDEYEALKDKFNCSQCGGNIPIPKIYFIATYLTCSACQTQNTFDPSTEAKGLEQLGRELAQERTAYLLENYNAENKKERDLYHQAHTLKLSYNHQTDKKTVAQIQQQIEAIEQERQNAIANAPKLYEIYVRAMYAEWSKLVPDLTAHNNKRLENDLESNRK